MDVWVFQTGFERIALVFVLWLFYFIRCMPAHRCGRNNIHYSCMHMGVSVCIDVVVNCMIILFFFLAQISGLTLNVIWTIDVRIHSISTAHKLKLHTFRSIYNLFANREQNNFFFSILYIIENPMNLCQRWKKKNIPNFIDVLW